MLILLFLPLSMPQIDIKPSDIDIHALREIPHVIELYQRELMFLEVNIKTIFTTISHNPAAVKTDPVVKLTTARKNGMTLFKKCLIDDAGSERMHVWCTNDHYSFSAHQQQDNQYLIASFTEEKKAPIIGDLHLGAYEPLSSLLKAIQKQDGYALLELSYRDDGKFIRARFSEIEMINDEPVNKESALTIEPGCHWRIIDSEEKTARRVTHKDYVYGSVIVTLSYPNSLLQRSNYFTDGGNDINLDITFDYRKTTREDSDFMLSGYGLPEPQEPGETHSQPNYIWLIIASMTALAFAIILRFIARKRIADEKPI